MDRAKPFDIPKREVWEAYVRANQGAAGVDGQSIADFEADLSNNLYKIWNRMSSGSWFPPPVKRVDIPKGEGKTRPLGIPAVADRVAQMVVKRYLEPRVEPYFHKDSYGYRPISGFLAVPILPHARPHIRVDFWGFLRSYSELRVNRFPARDRAADRRAPTAFQRHDTIQPTNSRPPYLFLNHSTISP